MSTEETEQQQHRSTSATTDEKVENGVEHTIIDIGDVECEGDQRGAYAKNIENEQKKNILERTIDENGDKEENLKKKTTEELNNGNSDTNNDNKKKKEEENDDTDYDDKKKKEIRDSINENAPCISVTNVGKSNSESPLVKPSEEKEENDKKNIKNTKVVTDAEAALKAVNEYNANEMFKHQFEQYKTDILDKLTELRQKVQLLNKANKSIVMMELVSFYTNVKEMKNPYILQAIISPYIAIHLLYHYKMIMLDHSFIEENQQIFDVFTNEQMQIMMYDIVKTIYGNGDFNYNEIRIQFYEDFIYPEKLIIGFEKILTTKQHQWLITLAKEILKSKEKYLQRYDNDQDRNLAEYHVQAIAKGNIPLEYMTEETLEYPKKTLNFIDMLSLENAGTFEKTIEKRQFETLLEAAKERKEKIDNFLTVSGTKMTEVDKLEYAHLESIIAG